MDYYIKGIITKDPGGLLHLKQQNLMTFDHDRWIPWDGDRMLIHFKDEKARASLSRIFDGTLLEVNAFCHFSAPSTKISRGDNLVIAYNTEEFKEAEETRLFNRTFTKPSSPQVITDDDALPFS